MRLIFKDSFEVQLNNIYSKIFKQFKLWTKHGINERNLTCNFVNSLQLSLKDSNSIACFEVPLENGTSRIDAFVYSPIYNSIFFIEAKKFKRNQPKYKVSFSQDIERLLSLSNRASIIGNFIPELVSVNQYLIIIADHWSLNNSDIIVKEWFTDLNEFLVNSLTNQANTDNYSNNIECIQSDNEKYMIFISCLKF